MIAKPTDRHDATCRYVKCLGEHWEYGVVEREGTNKPRNIRQGEAQTYEQAVAAAEMALCGQPGIEFGGFSCFGKS